MGEIKDFWEEQGFDCYYSKVGNMYRIPVCYHFLNYRVMCAPGICPDPAGIQRRIGEFIKKVESAQQSAANSKLRFKQGRKKDMYDLMYCEEYEIYCEVNEIIEKKHPELILEDGSDDIHHYRLVVKGEIDDRDWMKFVIEEGLANLSFMFTCMRMDEDKQKILIEVLKEVKAEKPELFKHAGVHDGE